MVSSQAPPHPRTNLLFCYHENHGVFSTLFGHHFAAPFHPLRARVCVGTRASPSTSTTSSEPVLCFDCHVHTHIGGGGGSGFSFFPPACPLAASPVLFFPRLYSNFCSGNFVLGRCDRYLTHSLTRPLSFGFAAATAVSFHGKKAIKSTTRLNAQARLSLTSSFSTSESACDVFARRGGLRLTERRR